MVKVDGKTKYQSGTSSFITGAFMAYVLLTPFYFWESGLPQPSHLVGAFLVFSLLFVRKRFVWDKKVMVPVALFAVYSAMANLFVYIHYQDTHSLLSALYYIFNGSLFWAVSQVLRIYQPLRVFRYLGVAFLLLLTIEALVYLLGGGRFFGESRFMGTFNDPNQMAHWSLWAVIIVLASDYATRRGLGWASWLALAFGLLLLLASASRSGLLGFVIIVLALATFLLGRRVRLRRSVLQKVVIVVTLVGALASTALPLLWLSVSNEKFQAFRERVTGQTEFYVARIYEGIFKSEQNFEERGYDRIWKFPEYLFFGAGEGANERWAEKSSFLGEIHSTVVGILFYYGLPGTLLMLVFYINVWASLPRVWLRLLLLAPLLYSLGTYNLRNSMFWLGMAVLWETAKFLKRKV